MITFKNHAEVEQAQLQPHIKKVVSCCMQSLLDAYGTKYDPENDGWVILLDSSTTDNHALELFGMSWQAVRMEGMTYDRDAKCFITCSLSNNQFGITMVIPDLPWLARALRGRLQLELCE